MFTAEINTRKPGARNLKSAIAGIAAAVLVAASATLVAAPASAQYRTDVRDGQVYRHDGQRGHDRDRHAGGRHHDRGGYRHHDRYDRSYRHWRRHACDPREAIAKARSWGMRHPDIRSVTRGEIVVSGRHRGHRALMVFDRAGRGCRVIVARGI